MSIPTWHETFLDLHSASTLDELWSTLLAWHGIGSSTQWEEPFILFRRFHAHDPEGAAVTAALLCTDYRWRKASHHLVVRIVESGVLSEADQHQLAEWFVAASLAVQIEAMTVDGREVVFASEPHGQDVDQPPRPDEEPDMLVMSRAIWPPLRRWAAAHLVRDEPSQWRALFGAAEKLPSPQAAALTAGVMDAAEHIPNDERALAIAAALDSGSGIVRLAALPAWQRLTAPTPPWPAPHLIPQQRFEHGRPPLPRLETRNRARSFPTTGEIRPTRTRRRASEACSDQRRLQAIEPTSERSTSAR